MPEPEAPAEVAPAPAASAPTQRSLFSPAGYVVIAMIMAVEALVVVFLTRYWAQDRPEPPSFERKHVQVDLGMIRRVLPKGDLGHLKDKFEVEISLILNPTYGDLDTIRSAVEARKDVLRDIVICEIIQRKNVEEFRKPNFHENLKREIKRRLNDELGYQEGGEEIIKKVIYKNVLNLPPHQ
ncbi:MAG: hypothetical protein ACYTAF_00555 [Planctomycetota bacterium]|jgi:hypothetical protein